MKCPYCSKEIKDDAKFCGYCGQTLTNAASTKSGARQEQPKSRTGLIIAVIVLAILVLLAVCAGLMIRVGIIDFHKPSTAATTAESSREAQEAEAEAKEESEDTVPSDKASSDSEQKTESGTEATHSESAGHEPADDSPSVGDTENLEAKTRYGLVTPGKLTVATSPDFAPYEFYSIDNRGNYTLAGFDIALAQYIADFLDLELEIIPMDFDGTLTELSAKKIDIAIAGYSPDPERMNMMDFSELYYTPGQSFCCTQVNKDRFSSLADTNRPELDIGVQLGSVQMGLAEEYSPRANIVSKQKASDVVVALVSGNLDGAYLETAVAEAYAKDYPELCIALTVPYDAEGSAVGVSKGNTALLDAVNKAITRAQNSGRMNSFVAEANELASGDIYEGLIEDRPAGKSEKTYDVPASQSEAAKEILMAEKGTKNFPNQNEDGTVNLDKVAHFDPDFDYANDSVREKLCYIATSGTVLYQLSADAYEHWCPLFNLEWADFLSSNGDSDMYLTMLQTKIDEGVKGFILDPDSTIFPSVLKILNQHPDVFWMSQMSAPRDGDNGAKTPVGGNLINSFVGFDNVETGRVVAEQLVKWKNETYPHVPWDEVGFLMMDYSASPALHDRYVGSREIFLSAGGRENNFFSADCVSTGMTVDGGVRAADPIVASHPEIKCWLCNGLFDDLAQGATSVFENRGLGDISAVCDFGGTALFQQWDYGQRDCFRFAVYTAQTLYAEPIIGAVVAYLNGWATPDSIWPSWVKRDDHGINGHTYSQLRLPSEPLDYYSYKSYLEWTDFYTHADAWPYDNDVTVSIDDFSPFVDKVPANYRAS